jgi:hypothetical protein
MSERRQKGKVIVTGMLFWYPLAGMTYQFLHYLIGLKRLGYDAYYIEDSGRWIYDPKINDLSADASGNIAAMVPILQEHGFGDRWAFRGNYPDGKCYGMSEAKIGAVYRDADALLNVTGAQELRDEHLLCRRRIYVESDPFALQVKVAKGDAASTAVLNAHDTLFSFGENLGALDCQVPVGQYRWLPTRQPVVIDMWPILPSIPQSAFNTITTWQNKGKNIEFEGDTWYWTKDREFLKFFELPQMRPQIRFELAAKVDDEVKQLLKRHGWLQVDSLEISADVDQYRRYIQNSHGEFTVARDQYTRPNTGWFSDRSACYLAAGRPVITQETGFSKFLPTGKGLFAFTTMDDILNAVDAIEVDYAGNCRAAREIAAEYFGAEKVIGSLLERAGL